MDERLGVGKPMGWSADLHHRPHDAARIPPRRRPSSVPRCLSDYAGNSVPQIRAVRDEFTRFVGSGQLGRSGVNGPEQETLPCA